MDFLEKLDLLMRGKGITKSDLARNSGIPYTTIDSFYKKGYENVKLSTLKKLCAYFEVPLDYWVEHEHTVEMDKKNSPSANANDESEKSQIIREIIQLLAELPPEFQVVALEQLRSLSAVAKNHDNLSAR